MDISKSPYFEHCNRFLSLFGLWPYQSFKDKCTYRFMSVFSVLTVFIPTLCETFEKRHSLDSIMLAMPFLIFYIQYFTKFTFLCICSGKIKLLLESVRHDFLTYKKQNLKILQDYGENSRKWNKIYAVCLVSSAVFYFLAALIPQVLDLIFPKSESRPKTISRTAKYNVDWIDNSYNFVIFHGLIVDSYVTLFHTGFDCLYLNLTSHICALFTIVVNTIEDDVVLKKDNNSQSSYVDWKSSQSAAIQRYDSDDDEVIKGQNDMFFRQLVRAINSHKRSIDFVESVDSVYTYVILYILSNTLVAIASTELQFVKNLNDTNLMISHAFFTAACVCHIFYYSWPAQAIYDHSLLVYQACYNCQFYRKDISRESKQLLKLMMLRGQVPSQLTAGKMYVLGFETFAKIVKTSGSILTLLLQFQ